MKKLIYLALVALMFSGCAKDGEDGKDGSDGAVGPTGPAGNANVKSFYFSTTPGSWVTYGTPGAAGHCKYVEFNIPEITQSVVNDGMVLFYWDQSSYYVQLPTVVLASPTQSINFFCAYSVGIAEVDIQLNNLQTPNTSTVNWAFKIVVATGFNRVTHPEINWKDYNQVARVFNL